MDLSPKQLQRLAARYGVATAYVDGLGRECRPGPDSVAAILKALGCPMEPPRDAREEPGNLPPALTRFGPGPSIVELPVPTGSSPIRAVLEMEDGAEIQLTAGDRSINVPAGLPHGIHTLRLTIGKNVEKCLFLSAPETVHPPEDLFPRRGWGLFMPLYAAWSEPDAGVGDLGDLERLMDWTGSVGGDLVGVLPLNATFLDKPFAPSPFTPASRLFWNELFLEADGPARIPPGCDVDYRAAMAAKRPQLESAAAASREYRELAETDPYLLPYARFRAETELRGAGWKTWPAGPRSGVLTVDDDDPRVQYHLYVQWAFQSRLQAMLQDDRPGRKLYADIPLGIHPDGFDTWFHPALFAGGVTVGAPPDAMFTGGQNWGFPPMLPEANRKDRYRYFSETIRRQARFASMLRIDHVMGLHRQFWIPEGGEASDGTYVTFPAEELYAVLTLESRRNRCAVAGEDLGAVPDVVRETMAAHRLQRLYVGQLQAPSFFPPEETVASLNTHDLRPFAGFLEGLDIADRLQYGLITEDEEAEARARRARSLKGIAAALAESGYLQDVEAGPAELLDAWLRWLGAGPARMVLVNAEDLWLESRAHNVPGTPDSRPNWVGRAARSVPDMEQSDRIKQQLKRLGAARRLAEDDR